MHKTIEGKNIFLLGILLLITFILGFFVSEKFSKAEMEIDFNNIGSEGLQTRIKTKDGMVSPLLLGPDNDKYKYNEKFSREIEKYIEEVKKDTEIYDVSFYVKNLNTGVWAGVNENQKYSPASLTKVPILLAIMKRSESEPGFLDKKVTVHLAEDHNNREFFKAENTAINGKVYTVRQLLELMIKYSDNNATMQLLSFVDMKNFVELYENLNIEIPKGDDAGTLQFMSPVLYSRLFRIIYNVTYLNQENSEYVMKLLTENNFENGIVRGVESGVLVADKFGERLVNNEKGEHLYDELHDCGIVFVPENPYAICVMTKGAKIEKLLPIISEISKKVYLKMILR